MLKRFKLNFGLNSLGMPAMMNFGQPLSAPFWWGSGLYQRCLVHAHHVAPHTTHHSPPVSTHLASAAGDGGPGPAPRLVLTKLATERPWRFGAQWQAGWSDTIRARGLLETPQKKARRGVRGLQWGEGLGSWCVRQHSWRPSQFPPYKQT